MIQERCHTDLFAANAAHMKGRNTMSMKVNTARFTRETGPRPLFRALQDGGFARDWSTNHLIIRRTVRNAAARLATSHRRRLEDFAPEEWTVLAIDLRLNGVKAEGLYLETVTGDGPLRVKVGGNTGFGWAHPLIYVTDSDGLSNEILGSGAVADGVFYEYVCSLWGACDQSAIWRQHRNIWQKYWERILKEDPAHYCLDMSGCATY